MVGAQRHGRGSSLGTGSRGSELDGLVGLPLNVFKYQKHLQMPYEHVTTNSYLYSKLDTNVSGTLRIKVSSPAMVDAFLIACREVCGSQCSRHEVEQADQLHLYSAASEIGIPRLQGLCEDVIASRFTPKRFVAAVRIALRHSRDSMLRLCYFWFKTQGATDYEAYLRRLDMTTTEKAMDEAFTTNTVTKSQLFYHRDTREISAGGNHRFSVDVFNSTLQTEHARKSHLFRPPIPLLEIPEEDEENEEAKKEADLMGPESTVTEVVKNEDLIVDRTVEETAAAQATVAAAAVAAAAAEMAKTAEASKASEGHDKETESIHERSTTVEEEKEKEKEKEEEKETDTRGDSKKDIDRVEAETAKVDAGKVDADKSVTGGAEHSAAASTDEEERKKDTKTSITMRSHDTQIQSALDAKGFDGLKKCHVVRERRVGPNRDQTRYVVVSESDGEFIVAAISTTGTQFSFSLNPDDFSPESPDYVGSMDCSFTGTTFTLCDYGMSHDLVNEEVLSMENEGLPGVGYVEHCVILYETNILGRVPNAMMVHIPHGRSAVDAEIDDDLPYHKTEAADNGCLALVTESGPDFSRLQTRKPIWSDDLEAWTMDFHGRVKLASKKNFLLVSERQPDEVLMLFGKVAKTHFSLDFKAPMTVMQAFAIALTSFADKMLVT